MLAAGTVICGAGAVGSARIVCGARFFGC